MPLFLDVQPLCRLVCQVMACTGAFVVLRGAEGPVHGVVEGVGRSLEPDTNGALLDLPWPALSDALWIADASVPGACAWPPAQRLARQYDARFIAGLPLGEGGQGVLWLFERQPRLRDAVWFETCQPLLAVASQWLSLTTALQSITAREREFRLLAETTTDTLVRGTLDGVRRYVSPSVHTLLGYAPHELIGSKAVDITHPEDAVRFRALMAQVRQGMLLTPAIEIRQRHKAGHWVWMEASLRLTYDTQTGAPDGYVCSVRDISHRKQLEAELRQLATHDALTGLPNRSRFLDAVAQLLAPSPAQPGTPSPALSHVLFYMDLDGFKAVNDAIGHLAGDALLQQVAQRLQACLGPTSTIARLGGDEFAALVPADDEAAMAWAARLIAVVRQPFLVRTQAVRVGLSIGMARPSPTGENPEQLLHRADQALYEAKSLGKNTWRFYREG